MTGPSCQSRHSCTVSGRPSSHRVIGTHGLQRAIEQYEFGPLFSSALTAGAEGELPEGQWKAALATRFDRTIYIYSVETTAADDAALVAAFNAAPNKSRFNFFYRNCSDQARRIFDLILPNIEVIGDRTGGVTMQTPKGLAKALVARALKNPEFHLRVRRYPQLPGNVRPEHRRAVSDGEHLQKRCPDAVVVLWRLP